MQHNNNEENYPIAQYQISFNHMPLEITLKHIFPYLDQKDINHLMQTNKPIKAYLETAEQFAAFVKTRGEKMEEMSPLDFQQCIYDFIKTYVCINCNTPAARAVSVCVTGLPGIAIGPTVYLTQCFGIQGPLQFCFVKNSCALIGVSVGASMLTFAFAPLVGATCLFGCLASHSFFADKRSEIQEKKNKLNTNIKEEFEKVFTKPAPMSMMK